MGINIYKTIKIYLFIMEFIGEMKLQNECQI